MRSSLSRLLAACGVAALAAGAGPASALDYAGVIEPTYTNTETDTRDPTGLSHSRFSAIGQRYRLNLDDTLAPLVRLSAGGNFDWTLATSTQGGVSTDSDSKRFNGFGRLSLGNQVLGGVLTYNRTDSFGSSTVGGVTASSPHMARDVYGGTISWNPADLPTLTLRLARTENYDLDRRTTDTQTDEALLSASYKPADHVETQFTSRYADSDNRISEVEQRELSNSARVAYSDRLLGDRLNLYSAYAIANRSTAIFVRGPTGTVAQQAFPTAGLSLVEAFPATPERDTLQPTPTLIDNDVTTTTGVGIDLGFGRSLAGDNAYRDLGGQFGTALSEVNTLYVYVDRQLTPEVVAAIPWSAFQSDDNITWTPIPIVGPVVFGQFDNRFEITIARTQARYLKVVTKPLTTAVTTDQRYASINVTELQFQLVQPAATVKGTRTQTSGVASTSARYLIYRPLNFSYDGSAFVTHSNHPTTYTWSIVNGLSLSKRLTPTTGFSARLDRSDSEAGSGHESQTRGSAALAYDPLPTLGGTLTYAAQTGQSRRGTNLSNSLSTFVRADVYQGVSFATTASAGIGRNETDQQAGSLTYGASLSVTPHRTTTITSSYGYFLSFLSGGGQASRTDRSTRADLNVSWAPIPAFFAAGGVAHSSVSGTGSTLANVTAGLSPFPRGDLQLRFGYSDSLDTSANLRQRQWGPGVRWNIRRGIYADASYSVTHSSTPLVVTDTRSFLADLVIAVR